MITWFPTDANLQMMVNTSTRVCTQVKIDHSIKITIDTITILGKATLTEHATTVA